VISTNTPSRLPSMILDKAASTPQLLLGDYSAVCTWTSESPNKLESIKLYMIRFVDNSTSQVNNFSSDNQPHQNFLIKQMKPISNFGTNSCGLLEAISNSPNAYHVIICILPRAVPRLCKEAKWEKTYIPPQVTASLSKPSPIFDSHSP
jgi:hypothetical protein